MKTQPLEYRDGATMLRGFLAYDDGTRTTRPGVIIMPEIWGLGDHAKERAQRLAALGYAALAADPYGDGVQFRHIQDARPAAQAVREDATRMRNRIRAALDALLAQPVVDAKRVAAIGYCMGGSFVLELARSGAPIRGAAAFHAGLEAKQRAEAGQVMAKVLVCTGADDQHVPWEQLKAFAEEMRNAGVDYQINVYGGAQHGFAVPGADARGLPGLRYNAEADVRSWAELLRFFREIFGET
jgi:dienelactone hydrolase